MQISHVVFEGANIGKKDYFKEIGLSYRLYFYAKYSFILLEKSAYSFQTVTFVLGLENRVRSILKAVYFLNSTSPNLSISFIRKMLTYIITGKL